MLKIYDSKDQIPEALLEHYNRRADGKYEPIVEGINSIGGLIEKRDELLEKVKTIPGLKTRIGDLEGLETLPSGKVAVDKAEFETLKAQHEAYSALGEIDAIKPKVEGYDDLRSKDDKRAKEEVYRTAAKTAGYDESKFIKLAGDDNIETVIKAVTENGKSVEKVYVKTKDDKGKETETAIDDYVKTSPNFAPFADSLTVNSTTNGTKVIRQGPTTTATPTIETEKEAIRANGAYGAL
ncbi:MAG: hypothetical protein ABIR33_09505 [Pyrinomonadaceae bacterium]